MTSYSLQEKETLRQYIKSNTFKEADLIQDSTLIFQEGFFDSMGFVMLLDFIEENFGVKTNDEDLIEENFESIDAISEYISRRLNSN